MQKLPCILIVSGITLLVLGVILGWVVVPNIIDDQIAKQVQLRNGTDTFDKWSDIPIPVYMKFYIFNVTNPKDVERGEKPIFQQVGPYVYREKRTKTDISFSEDEEIVTYRQPIAYFFEESMSAGSENDAVNIINVPFVVVSRMVEKIPYLLRYLVNLYVLRFQEKLFIEKTVGELLFQGYHQPMMAEIEALSGMKILHEQKFGLYYPTVATMVHAISPKLANVIINVLRFVSLGSESLVRKNIKLGDLTFRGFPVPYYAIPLEIISRILASLNIPVPELPPEFEGGRFGFYNGKNNTDDGIYEIYSGVNDLTRFGTIKTWNNKTKLDWWLKSPGDYCNMLNGTDGSIFPPFITKDRVLRLFNADLCRSLYLTYDHETEFMGISGYRFTAPRSMLEDPLINNDNLCFCPEQDENYSGCLKAGAIRLASCRDGAPVAMSTPHFYEAAEEYLDQTIGLNPVKEMHETYIDIEPTTGLAMQAHKRIQVNVELKKMSEIDAFKNVPEMLFPILWADETAELDEENADEVKRRLVTPLKIVSIAKWSVLGLSYLIIVGGGAICFIRIRRKKYQI